MAVRSQQRCAVVGGEVVDRPDRVDHDQASPGRKGIDRGVSMETLRNLTGSDVGHDGHPELGRSDHCVDGGGNQVMQEELVENPGAG